MLHATAETFATLTGTLLLGVLGGLGHCTTMCGGFPLALDRVRPSGPVAASADQVLFHAGRVTTYMGLSLALSGAGQWIAAGSADGPRRAWAFLLGTLLLYLAASLAFPRAGGWLHRGPARRLGRRIGEAFRRLWRGGRIGVFVSGIAWGWLPCVFSGSAVVAASAQPPAAAAATILAFGAGTALPLAGIAVVGRLLDPRRIRWLRFVAAGLLAAYGGRLALTALAPHLLH